MEISLYREDRGREKNKLKLRSIIMESKAGRVIHNHARHLLLRRRGYSRWRRVEGKSEEPCSQCGKIHHWFGALEIRTMNR